MGQAVTLRAALAALLLAAVAATARASLKRPPPPHEIAEKADVVFVGTVESVGKDSMRVAVGEVLKGKPAAVVSVQPIHLAECCPSPDEQPTPAFKTGDRIVVEATAGKDAYDLIGGANNTPVLATDADVARATKFVKEMVRIAELPDLEARRDAMIVHMSSKDPALVDAAAQFQFDELNAPDKARAHVAGLLEALDAPLARGRIAAMNALAGVVPPVAVERLVELSRSGDRDEVDAACGALGPYDGARAVQAVVEASERAGNGWMLRHLALNVREDAQTLLRAALRSRDKLRRAVAFAAYAARFAKFEATAGEMNDYVGVLLGGIERDEIYPVSNALVLVKSEWLAAALVGIVGDEKSGAPAREACYRVLNELATTRKMGVVGALLAKHEDLFIRRLDERGDALHLHWILRTIHSDKCKACLERAMKRQDTDDSRGDAWRTLHDWDAK